MARPESFKDITEPNQWFRIATIETDKLITNHVLLKAYTSFVEAFDKQGGRITLKYGSIVDVELPKTEAELQQQLDADQREWDRQRGLYNRAVRRDNPLPDDAELREWEITGITRWAKDNGFPDPYGVFVANDTDLQEIRDDLGMDNDDA